ncbi:hypothetical protein U9M48_029895 [Paspalum notatum var. saurae]|uniref:Protein kinase domain-containing protein n=1 Tax=Paspalum notatum var. saurae TaxID=547442 RepID=A0AAQ3TZU4_PASNO
MLCLDVHTLTGQKKLLLLVVATTVLILQYSTVTDGAGDENSGIAKPGCQDKCGNVSIPFPFGIGHGCFLNYEFKVNCTTDNVAMLSYFSYTAFFSVTDLNTVEGTRLLEINVTLGEARIQSPIGRWCNYTDNTVNGSFPYFNLGPSFVVSGTKNIFTGIGCATVAFFSGENKHDYASACGSFCSDEDSIDNSTDCSGNGCCQTSIPGNLDSFYLSFETDSDYTQVRNFSPCSYGFIIEEDSFKFDPSYANSSSFEEQYGGWVPLVLDWVIGNETCEVAKKNQSSYACAAINSICIDVPSAPGYLCNCSQGYEGNPYIDGSCQDINECDSPWLYPCQGKCKNTIGNYTCSCPLGTQSKDPKTASCTTSIGMSIGIGVVSAAGVMILVLVTIFFTKRSKRRRARKLKQKFFDLNRGQLLKQLVSQRADIAERMIITLDDLEKATNNFDESRELGGGGHGTVYKGILSDLQVVAIKKSNIVVQKEIDEFINEVAILSQINHKNVVKLIGCCLETEVPLLVYEFISNGTLYHHLHAEGSRALSWGNRLRIAAETSNALAYLHSSCSIPIIHRDIKPSNILLDDNLTSRVSDFGASRYIPVERSGLTTMVQGTIGYLDPMYFYTGRLNEKSDVYSFGVVLVELLTRKKTFPNLYSEGEGLVVDFACLHDAGNLIQILDPQVVEEGGKEVQEVAQLAASCVKLRGEDRPTMKQVNRSLEGILSPGMRAEDDCMLVDNEAPTTGDQPRMAEDRCMLIDVDDS